MTDQLPTGIGASTSGTRPTRHCGPPPDRRSLPPASRQQQTVRRHVARPPARRPDARRSSPSDRRRASALRPGERTPSRPTMTVANSASSTLRHSQRTPAEPCYVHKGITTTKGAEAVHDLRGSIACELLAACYHGLRTRDTRRPALIVALLFWVGILPSAGPGRGTGGCGDRLVPAT